MKSLFNSWLEPSTVGDFTREGTTEIRTSLSIQDSPLGIPGATDPVPDDLVPTLEEYRFGPGDVMTVRILDLLARGVETPANVRVNEIGNIRVPVVGRVQAGGLTTQELEEEIADYLDQQEILRDAQVIIEPLIRRGATFTVFGAIAGPNIYPLDRPGTTLLEGLNLAGGLADPVTSVYVFRQEEQSPVGPIRFEPPPPALPEAGTAASSVYLGSEMGGAASLPSHGPADASFQPGPDRDQVPPGDEDNLARREMIEAVAPPATQNAQGTEALSQPAAEEHALQSRWIFLNGKWIEVQPEPSLAEPAEQPSDPGRALERLPEPPGEPRQTIDWSQVASESHQRIIHVSAEALRNGDTRQNILIRSGDTIRVMAGQTGEYYMMGQINRPGAYALGGRRLTLKTAIASAGNLGALAWPERCTIYRRLGDREEMIQVNVDRVFTGQDPDFYIKQDDLIVFGTHPAAVFLAIMRNAFRLTYGFGFVYDRNFADVDGVRRSVAASSRAQAEAQQSNRFQGLFP